MIFANLDELAVSDEILRSALEQEQLSLLCWRDVPVNEEALGATALASMPVIRQALITPLVAMQINELKARLYRARKIFERANLNSYIASLSAKTIVYKALCTGAHLREFYLDLQDANFETAFVVFHQRYATNTQPTWRLAQPFRTIAHNGEINTVRGNRAQVLGRIGDRPDIGAATHPSDLIAAGPLLRCPRWSVRRNRSDSPFPPAQPAAAA